MMAHLAVKKVDLSDKQKVSFRPAVIFGHRNKLTAEGPFLDLLRVFVDALDSSELLTIFGYSFGDPHINTLLMRWMNGSKDRHMRIVNPQHNNIHNRFIDELGRMAPTRKTILLKKASEAIAELYGESQQQDNVF